MINLSLRNLLCVMGLLLAFSSCSTPNIMPVSNGFPCSTTETHTKTTIVTPPSYATVNIPPPMISQGSPVVQQPMMYQAPMPLQSSQVQSQPQNNCYPIQSNDPCNYNVSVPQQEAARYTIAIPPAPSPQYTIALPQGNPPQYAVVQNQQPVTATMPVKVQAVNPINCD